MDLPISSFSDGNPGTQLRVGDQLIRYDREFTQQAYAGVSSGGAEQCNCEYCANFVAQRATVYPKTFLALLEKLGIDPNKEGEVYEVSPVEEGKHLYGGWFFFTGQFLEIGERRVEEDEIGYFITDGRRLPRPDGEFGLDLLAIDFLIKVPWVLTEQPIEAQSHTAGGQP